jgi:hypothetical protein
MNRALPPTATRRGDTATAEVPLAAKHYLQVTDEHYARAVEGDVEALQNAVQRTRGRFERATRKTPCFRGRARQSGGVQRR